MITHNGGGMRSCRLRANDLSSYTGVDAGDGPANCATPGSFLYHVLWAGVYIHCWLYFSKLTEIL